MIIGADLGNKKIKTSTRDEIDNKMRFGEPMLKDSISITLNGVTYSVGEGDFQTEPNKLKKEGYLVSLFASIAMSTEEEVNQVVVGLPISHYKLFREPLKELILNNNFQQLEYNGSKRSILITDVEVAPEGAVAYKSLSRDILSEIGYQDLVIIDIGGRSTDICLYQAANGKRQITKYKTVMVGTLNIYDEIAQAVNAKFGLDKSLEDGEQILKDGLKLYGIPQDLSFIKPTLKMQTDKIFKELNMNFPIATAQSLLIGGGSLTLQGLLQKNIPNVIMANEPIFGNALGMKKVGEDLWDH